MCVLFVSLLSKVARHFVQVKVAWERSASIVDATDAVAVAPIAGMFWRRTIDPLKAIDETNNWQ